MTAEVISCDKDEVVVQVKIKLKDSMLESEESILSGVNEVGAVATQEVLKHFDADGSKIVMGCQWGPQWSHSMGGLMEPPHGGSNGAISWGA